MKKLNLIDELGIDKRILDEKKQQTDYKIKYVVEYVKRWLIVAVNRNNISDINFVDCMCNAGIYLDGDLGTSVEIFKLFNEYSYRYPKIKFNLFVNDIDKNKILILNKIIGKFHKNCDNLIVEYSNLDVNEYLLKLNKDKRLKSYASMTLLFVDPYNLGTVIITSLKEFISQHYCEVIFNFFISDYTRNKLDSKIGSCIENEEIKDRNDMIEHVCKSLRVGKMNYLFKYQFRTKTNNEIYQILYITPHKKGLEKLKEALWEVFKGKKFHRNNSDYDEVPSLFGKEDEKKALLSSYASEAKEILLIRFKNKIVKFVEIEIFLIENTMMQSSDILEYVLKPLIEMGLVRKCNNTSKRNYKIDSYAIGEG